MAFWKLLAYLWPSAGSRDLRRSQSRRVPAMDSLNESDRLEHRSVHSTMWNQPDECDRARAAEVASVSSARERHQLVRSQSQFRRLSVVVVDYLLEHEWFSLLAGHRRRASGDRRARRGPRDKAHSGHDGADPLDESNRTACVSNSPWSIVAAIEQTTPPCSTTTTDE